MVQRRFICTWILIFFAIVQQSTAAVTDTSCVNDIDCTVDHSECDNVAGPPKCKCSDGYKEDSNDGSTCVKIPVSETPCQAASNDCLDDNSVCESGNCKCSDGYKEDSNDGSTCVKIPVSETPCGDSNVCSDGNSVCDTGNCKCSDGFKEDLNDGSTCVDIVIADNDCTNGGTGNRKCLGVDPNAECADTDECACKADHFLGFDGTQCVQSIEEITCTPGETENTKCQDEDVNAECQTVTNTCTCKAEYYLSTDKKSCVQKIKTVDCTHGDDTECKKNDANSECLASDTCACNAGYKGTDYCTKILTGQCTTSGDCTGTVPNSVCSASTCSCVAGYKEANDICVKARVSDKTCDAGDEDCPVDNSECDDADNTPMCKCSGGYKEDPNDGSTCVKIPAVSETDCNPANNDDTTGESAVCKAVDVNAECPTGTTKCACKERYKEGNPDSHTCVLKAVSEIDCNPANNDETTGGAAVCKAVDINAECPAGKTYCACKDGYKEGNPESHTCVMKAAESSATSAWLTTSLLLTSMLISLPRFILW